MRPGLSNRDGRGTLRVGGGTGEGNSEFGERRLSTITLRDLEATPLSVPTVDPFVIATGQATATRSVLVRATVACEGRTAVGLGEGSCLPPVTREDQPDAVDAAQKSQRLLLGRTWQAPKKLGEDLDGALNAFPVARAAVEMAVLDAWAQLDGHPLYRWLGGPKRAPLLETDITLPILPVKRQVELAREWWAKGFRSFKVKLGKNLQDDVASLDALVKALPAMRLRLDANAGQTPEQALTVVRELYARHAFLECYEQPCLSLQDCCRVTRDLEVPVVADESVKHLPELQVVLAQRAATGVNLKIAKSGGILEALAIGRAAANAGLSVMVGGMLETRLGMTAAAHLAAALGGADFCDLDTAWLLKSDPFRGGYAEDGPRYQLGETPGLGVRLKGE